MSDPFDRWMHSGPPRPISRRDLLRNAGVGALGLSMASILAACGSGETDEPSAVAGSASVLPAIAGELSVAQWPLYIDRDHGDRPSLDAFSNETGIEVDYREVINDNQDFFASLIPLFQAQQSTKWDITALSDWVVNLMRQQGWIESLDWNALPTVTENMLPAFRDPAYDPANAHSVPWQGGVTGIAYYPDRVPGGKIEAFEDLWNPALEGHVGMLTEMVDTMTLTLLMLGFDPQTATLDDAKQAQAKLIEQRDAGIVRQYVGQGYVDDLVNGNNWASMAWSGDIFYYKYLGGAPDLEFVVPSEGGVIWTGPLQIPVMAEHPADAHAFMDFYYRPEIAAMVTDWVLYMTPVDGVRDIMLEKADTMKGGNAEYYRTLAESELLFPPEDPASANLYEYKAFDGPEYEAYNALFEQVVSG
jgi:spermidine/putrescine transport system substrate-binding protein